MIKTGFLITRAGAFPVQCRSALTTYLSTGAENLYTLRHIQVRNYAARKGYRKQREAKKVKKEDVKIDFKSKLQMEKQEKLRSRQEVLTLDDSWKPLPKDNVYAMKYYQWKNYPFREAVECHKETHHPEMYNKPREKLNVKIELNMEGEKKTRFVENFHRVVAMPHKFDLGEERTVLALAKSPEIQREAKESGATLVGGIELIREIQNGSLLLTDFQTVVAHPEILPDLVILRGIMKKKFPVPKNGTLDPDLSKAVNTYVNGLKYSAAKNEFQKTYGLIETFIGTLDMELDHLEENFSALIRDIYKMKPKREGEFIRRCILWSPPSSELFKVNYEVYLEDLTDNVKVKDEIKEDDQVEVAVQ